jgi:hypothetical protein
MFSVICKTALLRFAFSIIAGAAVLCAAAYLLSAPRLGPHYDFLMGLRRSISAGRIDAQPLPFMEKPETTETSRRILLIETGSAKNVIKPETAFSIVMTLNELNADALIVEVPVLASSVGTTLSDDELSHSFDEEFGMVETNIKNLFDGIRLGSIAPLDAEAFVNEVIRLAEQSKERLLSTAVNGGEYQPRQFENAAAAFGNVYIPSDLILGFVGTENGPPKTLSPPVYSRVQPDADRKVRRIVPVMKAEDGTETEHIAFAALKSRFQSASIQMRSVQTHGVQTRDILTENGFVLAVGGRTFALDRNAALIFDIPAEGADAFRNISVSLLLEYAEADRALYRLLAETPTLAFYVPAFETYPPILFEQALAMRETLLESPDMDLQIQWKDLRTDYYGALAAFFDEEEGAGVNIRRDFSGLAAQEQFGESGIARLNSLRDGQLDKFGMARELYLRLSALRSRLAGELNAAFCILTPADSGAKYSALFANSILTGNYIEPAGLKRTMLISSLCVLTAALIFCSLPVAVSLGICVLTVALAFAGFSYGFVASGVWADPLIPVLALAACGAVSCLCGLLMTPPIPTIDSK